MYLFFFSIGPSDQGTDDSNSKTNFWPSDGSKINVHTTVNIISCRNYMLIIIFGVPMPCAFPTKVIIMWRIL